LLLYHFLYKLKLFKYNYVCNLILQVVAGIMYNVEFEICEHFTSTDNEKVIQITNYNSLILLYK